MRRVIAQKTEMTNQLSPIRHFASGIFEFA